MGDKWLHRVGKRFQNSRAFSMFVLAGRGEERPVQILEGGSGHHLPAGLRTLGLGPTKAAKWALRHHVPDHIQEKLNIRVVDEEACSMPLGWKSLTEATHLAFLYIIGTRFECPGVAGSSSSTPHWLDWHIWLMLARNPGTHEVRTIAFEEPLHPLGLFSIISGWQLRCTYFHRKGFRRIR